MMRGPALALGLLLAVLVFTIAFPQVRGFIGPFVALFVLPLLTPIVGRPPDPEWPQSPQNLRAAVATLNDSFSTMIFLLFAIVLVALLFALHQLRQRRQERKASSLRALMTVVDKTRRLEAGEAYVIPQGPTRALKIFTEELKTGVKGLCISRTHPNKLKETNDLKGATLVWLDGEVPKGSNSLQELSVKVSKFVYSKVKGVVLLDGVEYLILQNDFSRVMKFLLNLRDMLAARGAKLLVPVDLHALMETQRAELMGEFKEL